MPTRIVSIQLLLLFYSELKEAGNPNRSFNTTFVTVLYYLYCNFLCHVFVSIQLLLLFYGNLFCRNILILAVSIQLLLLFYDSCFFTPSCLQISFNTTFVTVLSAFLLVSYFIISQDIP